MRFKEQRKAGGDPVRLGLGGLTQHNLLGVRGMFYVGPALEAVANHPEKP